MNAKMIGILVAVAGVVLLIMGLSATDSFSEGVTHGVTGHYTDKTTWFIVGGIIAMVAGGLFTWRGGGMMKGS